MRIRVGSPIRHSDGRLEAPASSSSSDTTPLQPSSSSQESATATGSRNLRGEAFAIAAKVAAMNPFMSVVPRP